MAEWEKHRRIGECDLYLGDCTKVMGCLGGGVDAVVTDPPYGINENDRKIKSRGKLAAPRDYGKVEWDKEPVGRDVIDQLLSLSKYQIIFGGNYFEGLGPTSCWLVWDKMNGSNDFADCELAWTNLPKAVRRIQWRWNGMIRQGNDERVHPTQKPEGVMDWCLGHLPGGVVTVLDPFMGSGTTLVAAARRGLRGIGIERERQYFEAACRRVEDTYRQPSLAIAAPEPKAPLEQVGFDFAKG